MHQTALQRTQLGRTGLEITRVGFGAWAIGGGGWEFGWGPQDDEQSIASIHHALELGINWIDTAAAYGFGHSEQIVGRALEGLAERPYVFTKCSLLEGPGRTVVHSLKRDSILREAEASLQRLGVDAIDLYQIHWPNPAADIEEGWAALAELKRARPRAPHRRLQLRRRAAAADRADRAGRDAAAPVLAGRARDRAGAPAIRRAGGDRGDRLLADGLRTADGKDDPRAHRALPDDDWRKRDARFNEPQLSRNLELVERLKAVADRHDTTPGAVAVAWTLRNPAVDGAIVGFRRPDQVDPIMPAASLELTEADVAEIEGDAPRA